MARVNAKNLGVKFRYLSMIAFEMFRGGRGTITAAELKAIHQKYEKEYLVSIDQSKLLSELEEGQVLSYTRDTIRFKYKYGYYYFVAEYLHDGISNVKDAEALRQELKELADSAYNEQNAHILIFYLYMSKDRSLMEHILNNAQKLFASDGISDLDEDVAFVNAFYSDEPQLEAPPEDTGEDHVPTRMIDLAIKLDHFAHIPELDVEELKGRLKTNPAVYTILRLLVGEFLYLFPVDHRIRQKMIKLLDFQPGASTLAGAKKIRRLTTTAT